MKLIRIKPSIPLLLMLLMGFLPSITIAQSLSARKADGLYLKYAYSEAAGIYEELHRDDPGNSEYVQRLAYSYYKMADYAHALSYYALLVQTEVHQPSDYYDYAQLLRIAGRIEESKSWLEKYIVVLPGDQRAINQLKSISQLLQLKTNFERMSIGNVDGNSRFTDMCPAYYKDVVVYCSAKDSFSMVRNKFVWNDQPFLDLYVSGTGSNPIQKEDKRFSGTLNSRLHEGPICFTADFGTIYFTRNNFFNGKLARTPEGVNNLKIFIADYSGDEWTNIRELPFNSDAYSVGHPALSPDNKTLYFVSDMPGGFGETDIYQSEWTGVKWGKPLNLGESINTRGKEMFPYVDQQGILYFSSNGQPGIGGLDLFAAKREESGNYLVVNLGSPLNSPQDDFGFILKPDSLTGFFSSNRLGGQGGDDNYHFRVDRIELNVISYDLHSKEILPGTKIEVLDTEGKVVDSQVTDQDGSANFSVTPGADYQLMAENGTYVPEKKGVSIQSTLFDFRQHEQVYLKRGEPYLTIEVIDKESGLIIPNAVVDISEGKYNPEELEDNQGVLRMRLMPSMNYTFYATSEEYFDNTVTFTSIDKLPGEYTLTIELEKIAAGKQFVLDDLYYDLNKYNIRPDAAIVLDKLLKILVDNPEVRIEIGSHTDSRASVDYNQKLSQNRSESVVAYLVSKGISPSRLVAKGYGESQLINPCADGVDCPEIDHQANRRTVIEILNPNIRKVKRGAKNVYYF